MFVDKSLVVTANAGDLSQLPTDALEAELKKQLGLSQTINVTPSHTDTEDKEWLNITPKCVSYYITSNKYTLSELMKKRKQFPDGALCMDTSRTPTPPLKLPNRNQKAPYSAPRDILKIARDKDFERMI